MGISRALDSGGGEERRRAVAYALDYSCPDARDVPLDDLVPVRADDEGATWVDRGEEGVAVLQAVLEVLEGLVELVEEPFKLSALWRDRGLGQLWSARR